MTAADRTPVTWDEAIADYEGLVQRLERAVAGAAVPGPEEAWALPPPLTDQPTVEQAARATSLLERGSACRQALAAAAEESLRELADLRARHAAASEYLAGDVGRSGGFA